jgi:type VI secretion system protein ImpL
MIKKVFAFLLHPIFLTLLALLVIGILIWWIGPLVAIGTWTPLLSELARGIAIGIVVLLVVLRMLLARWRARRASAHLTDGLMKAPVGKGEKEEPENPEQKILNTRFAEAVASLRKMRMHAAGKKPGWRDWMSISSGSYLYELPWYVFIGAPGAGKTTALVNSGLSFPLADKFGPGAIRGVGGTRNCDWWFTDEAVLIDTAGRYTTQDSHQSEDKTAWDGFLQLLKKSRPRRPLNGVFLTISVADLLSQGSDARNALAASIRARLMELDTTLSTRLPVYVLVTKSDLLHGFNEYFANLGKDQRAQVWGFTLPLQDNLEGAQLGPMLDKEFSLLSDRLDAGLVERMQNETDSMRRAAVFSFPVQFAAIGPLVSELMNQVLSGSKFTQTPWVRGVYFTSGTQEGSPIDRMMGNLARGFGIENAVAPPSKASARSFFLTSLLQKVVFPEQRLASADVKWERRRHVLRMSAFAAMGASTLFLIGGWAWSTVRNLDYLKTVEAQVEPARRGLAAMPASMQSPAQVAPVLQGLREIWRTPALGEGSVPVFMGLGLYQGEKINGAAWLAHQKSLNDVFLPQLARRVEDQLRGAQKDNLEFAYEALKSYLMLHQPEHFDSDALKAWITLDWNRSLDRGVPEEQRKALEEQLDALLAQGAPRSPLPLDENLVRSVRAMLASYPLEQRIFSRLKRMRTGSDIAPFTVASAAGPSAPLVFERASGKPLTEGVPGMFTYDGYHKRFQSSVVQLTGVMALEEPWVLGLERSAVDTAREVAGIGALTDRVRRIYLENYVKEWDALLNDVRLLRSNNLDKNIQIARTLSGSSSPHVNFLRAVVRETTLIAPDSVAKNAVNKATESVRSTRKSLEELFTAPDASKPVETNKRIESIVDDHFEVLRKQVMAPAPNQPAPIDDTLKLFNDVYVYLTAVDTAAKSRSPMPAGDIAGKLKADAGRLPEPMRTMVETLSQSGAAQAMAAERGSLSQDVKPVTDFCARAIAGRYPLVASSSRDALPEDFGQFFGPGGMMDEFFQKRLANLVDTSTKPWKYKPVAGQASVSSSALVQFERAARIREIFFRGGKTPSIRLDFKVMEMDANITQFVLDVDGQLVKYAHGPVLPMAVQWPGTKGSNQVRVQLSPPSVGGTSGLVADGPWALFRVMEKAQLENSGVPEKFFVTFNVENRKTRFEVTTNSVQSPLRVRELQEFSCPEGL